MTTWTITLTVPIGLLLRALAWWVFVGVLLAFPLDRVLWRIFVRRGYRLGSYGDWVRSRGPRWYPGAILRWPMAAINVTRGAWFVEKRLGR